MNESEFPKNHIDTLFVDVGNSFIKLKFFDGDQWRNLFKCEHEELGKKADYFFEFADKFESVVMSSVVDSTTSQLRSLFAPKPVRIIAARNIPGQLLDYETPETLGIDRFLACYGAFIQSPKAVVVIDAGTACTVDFMDQSGIYHGGVIMPGLRILEESLKEFAPSLPSVERVIPHTWPGKSTSASLQWGLAGAYIDMLVAALERYTNEYGEYDLWLTGGDIEVLTQYLEHPFQVNADLVFEGMRTFISRDK